MRRLGVAFAIMALLVLLGPTVASQEASQEVNARRLNALLYHPYPDVQGDTWGFPEAGTNGTKGYMESRYAAFNFPYTVFDGLERYEGANDRDSVYRLYAAALEDRLDQDSPVRLFLLGRPRNDTIDVEVRATAKKDLASNALVLRIALFEDEVHFDGGNGVKVHRFVVRAVSNETLMDLRAKDSTIVLHANFTLNATWDPARLGFVASLHNRDAASPEFAPDEVLQSATWIRGQAGPTIQVRRGVLMEMLSATWCTTCIYGDAAADRLANEYGVASSRHLEQLRGYLRGIDVMPLIGAGAGGLLIAFLAYGRTWWRRP